MSFKLRIWACVISLTFTGLLGFFCFGNLRTFFHYRQANHQWNFTRTGGEDLLIWRVDVGPSPTGGNNAKAVISTKEILRIPMWPMLGVSVVCTALSLWYASRPVHGRGFPVDQKTGQDNKGRTDGWNEEQTDQVKAKERKMISKGQIWACVISLAFTGLFGFLYFGYPRSLFHYPQENHEWDISRTSRGELLVWRVDYGPTPIGWNTPNVILSSQEVLLIPMWPFLGVSVVGTAFSLWYASRSVYGRGLTVGQKRDLDHEKSR